MQFSKVPIVYVQYCLQFYEFFLLTAALESNQESYTWTIFAWNVLHLLNSQILTMLLDSRTEMGGKHAPRSPLQGRDSILSVLDLPENETGGIHYVT